MDRVNTTLGAAAVTLVIGALLATPFSPLAKEPPGAQGIPPEKVADYVQAILQADRTIYTTQVVTRMQEKGIVKATEHWEHDNALPLPAQFLQHSGRLVAESGRGIRYRLIGLSPIYQRNAPATDFERKALETLTQQPDRPVTGIVTSGKKQFFQAIYPDRAVSPTCIACHNSHPLSPKRNFKVNDVMGGIAITIPLE
ncbi:Tll0287-like domain-containing protein [Nitrospira sp. NS4]|uniref:Tll0287-like domain-containing protein n=1 Tax=Nitrospira sp. NS4 TaxID=3414498 RepID=UPI003C2DEBDD